MKHLTALSSSARTGEALSARTEFDAGFAPLESRSNSSRPVINLPWLTACLLVSVSGGALIGTALYGAVETEGVNIERPERVVIRSVRDFQDSDVVGQKGDRLALGPVPAAAKKEFSAPSVEQVGDHEVIRTRAYVRLKTDLSLTRAEIEDMPPFDFAHMVLEREREAPVEDEASASYDPSETEATIIRSSLAALTIQDDAPALTEDNVADQIRELTSLTSDVSHLPEGFTQQRILARTFRFKDQNEQGMSERAPSDPFDAIDVRVAPENVVSIPKNQLNSASPLYEEREITLERGETLEFALRKNGATQARTDKILAALGSWPQSGLPEGPHIRLLLGPQTGGRPIEKVTIERDGDVLENVAENDQGQFVPVLRTDQPSPEVASSDDKVDEDGEGVSLYESVYETCLENGIPRPIIDTMIRALAYNVDFNRQATHRDGLSLFFVNDEGRDPELLYVALKIGDEIRKAYRYQSPVTGDVEYLDEEGHSAKKLLVRKPVAEGRLSSPFGGRFHPILGYTRPHNGVDWAAPRGTPIMATGDGIVEAAGTASGYGNHIEIRHLNGYMTGYGHLARIARGITPGATVRQGQVIGYVGSTGLSTGPHVHYEVKINDRFVDPMKVRLPDGQGLTGEALASFQQEGRHMDDLRHKG
ncbi:M23 family metallopeptidase [Microvirga sp. TS319]|uniref:M23 family metallopeptidase n=1 Tax=Microvirga sp. TS319 TaxID=3241165 RepID=UPI00351A4264